MADAVLSRGGTSVTIPILQSGSTLAIARDVGKPNMNVREVGREDPLTQDNLSAGDSFLVTSILIGSDAYSRAKTIAEDLIKARPDTGSPLDLDLSDLPGKSSYDVAAATGQACVLNYVPGRVDMVGVQMVLQVISGVTGGTQQTQTYSDPDAGSGVKIDRGGTSVTLTEDISLTRTVGRPATELHPVPGDLPRLVDRNDPASDLLELSGELSSGATAETLEETITRARLGSDTLTLHFLGNLWGLDAYPVVPDGSQSLRTAFYTGETGRIRVPKLAYRVVEAL